ncbi:MAG: hypothetical protein N3G20_05970, partial [Verrucomicrobiae bacterium]|nr:hypothetical protein [Verrucomicrobiae bacterium]
RETLTFHCRGLPGYAETLATPFIEDIAADQHALEVPGGINLREGKLRISLCGGVQTLWGDKQTLAGSTYQEAVRRVDVTDVYDVTGINIPDAPHRGTYAGPFDDPPVIPSPTIPNKPKKRVLTIRDLGWTGSNHITLDIESDLYSFWMGGLFSVGLGSRFSAGITPRISINHVKTDLKRVETFTLIGPETSPSEILNVWTDEEAASEWIFGCGLTLDLGFELGHRWSLGITGGHDWLADSLVTTVGPATVTFDATGYSLGVWLAKSF